MQKIFLILRKLLILILNNLEIQKTYLPTTLIFLAYKNEEARTINAEIATKGLTAEMSQKKIFPNWIKSLVVWIYWLEM